MQNAEKAVRERDFNRQLNEQLMRNQGALREQLAESEKREASLAAQVVDLEEQLRDLSFHFEAQLKILQQDGDGSASELSGGDVSAPIQAPTVRGRRKAKVRG